MRGQGDSFPAQIQNNLDRKCCLASKPEDTRDIYFSEPVSNKDTSSICLQLLIVHRQRIRTR